MHFRVLSCHHQFPPINTTINYYYNFSLRKMKMCLVIKIVHFICLYFIEKTFQLIDTLFIIAVDWVWLFWLPTTKGCGGTYFHGTYLIYCQQIFLIWKSWLKVNSSPRCKRSILIELGMKREGLPSLLYYYCQAISPFGKPQKGRKNRGK